MFKVIVTGIFLSVFSISIAQAALPKSVSRDIAINTDAAKEIQCLEAFIVADFKQAYKICLPLARGGFKEAQLVTGLMYALGEGVDKDMDRAKIWLEEAKKNGSDDAEVALDEFKLN